MKILSWNTQEKNFPMTCPWTKKIPEKSFHLLLFLRNFLRTTMAFSLSNSGNSSSNDIELLSLKSGSNSPKDGNNNKKKQERTVNFSSDIDLNGNKVPKKNVQFSEVSIESDTEAKPNLIPNRKRWIFIGIELLNLGHNGSIWAILTQLGPY